MTTNGGRLVVDALIAEGVDTVFTVPGESFLPVLDALYDPPHPISTISTRHEEGAGFAAEAYAKATGRPGVVMVTRGPGITNASIALHTAMQDCTPLVVFVGQVPVEQRYREAFQEVDLVSYLSPLVKWVVEVPQTARLPELVRQAFRVAQSGRPGPVVVGLPEDTLFGSAEVGTLAPVELIGPGVAPQGVARAAELLAAAERPVIVAGREVASADGHEAVRALARAWALPVMTGFRRFDAYPNDDANYTGPVVMGPPAGVQTALTDADTVLILGDRLDEITAGGYEYMTGARVIHVAGDASITGTWGGNVLAITASATAFAHELAAVAPPGRDGERARRKRQAYEEMTTPEAPFAAGGINISNALGSIMRQAPPEAAIVTDAGNFAAWVARYYRFNHPHTHFGPLSGAMGYAAPGALGVALADPGRRVLALAGDGGFGMTLSELASMKAHPLPITVIVFVNGVHGTIRMHQEKHYPGRPVATDLTNPRFRDLAASFGLPAWTVTSNPEFDAALADSLAESGPSLIEVIQGRERLSAWGKPRE